MDRSSARRLSASLLSALAGLILISTPVLSAAVKPKAAKAAPKVVKPLKHDRSQPLRSIQQPSNPGHRGQVSVPIRPRPHPAAGARGTDPVVQRQSGTGGPTPLLNFDGSSSADDTAVNGFIVRPSDSSGDAGAGRFVQLTTFVMQVWDNTGTSVFGPVSNMSLFDGFGGQCGDGENYWSFQGLVRYDEAAGRWVITYIPVNFLSGAAPTHLCMAVSTSSDPAGSYNRYEFDMGAIPDALRLGVWTDGYYVTFNSFDSGTGSFAGIMSVAFDRATMLTGGDAGAVGFNLADLGHPEMFSMVPADLDGLVAPPEGAPNPQATPGQENWDGSEDPVLHMFDFHADFETPDNSTLTGPIDVDVPDFNPVLCNFDPGCVPQSGGDGTLLNATPGQLMHGMQYRNFGTHESLVVSQTVNVAEEGDLAATRFYELRMGGAPARGAVTAFTLFQSGTYSPSETNRFVPSIAMDVSGNMAMGYSISDETIHPQIGVTGRLVTDPLGQMGSEQLMFEGTGSETGAGFWGNFTSMTVDPTNGCTFWYTNQYYAADVAFDWQTRIGTFRFDSCVPIPTGTIEGTVTNGEDPIQGATVSAGIASTTTDAAGHYSLADLPIGIYDMTVLKYLYLPGSATGIEVADGETTTQDFVLETAPTQLVNGTVRDSLGGWPLYAQINITAPTFPGATVWTDPVTGYYSVTLAEGLTYTFEIRAVSAGYQTGGGQVPLGVTLANAPFVVQNWTLEADLESCSAPGYNFEANGLYETFSSGNLPPGWSITNDSEDGGPPWTIFSGPDPCGAFSGNQTGGAGPYAVINSNCDGFLATALTDLITPSVDLSAVANPVIQFKSDFIADFAGSDIPTLGMVDYSTDGGTVWTNVFTFDTNQPGPSTKQASLPSAADVKVRFHYDAFWAWWWQVDNVLMGTGSCQAGTGGLVVGNVTSVNTGLGLNGATVVNVGGASTTTFATPDPAQEDGFYILYSEAGPNTYQASLPLYASQQRNALVVPGSTQRVDFQLASGSLLGSPGHLSSRVDPGDNDQQTLTLVNSGGAPASFRITEIGGGSSSANAVTGPFADPHKAANAAARMPKPLRGLTSPLVDRKPYLVPGVSTNFVQLNAGDLLDTFTTSFPVPGAVMFNSIANDAWVGNFGAVAAGENLDYQFLTDGTETGETIDFSAATDSNSMLSVDGAFNARTGMLWQMFTGDFGDPGCAYELDPQSKVLTGNTICPEFTVGQSGLAYDPVSDTYWSASLFDATITHFDPTGTILDSAFTGLPLMGLAYNPVTHHLFAITRAIDVVVLDPTDGYSIAGAFSVGGGGVFQGDQSGADMACNGNLWLAAQSGFVYVVDSGESDACSFGMPWLTEDPSEGTVGAAAVRSGGSASLPIAVTFDSAGLLPGLRQGLLTFSTDTPAAVPSVGVDFTVRFLDVPDSNQFDDYIYGAAGAGVMMGGPPTCPAGVLNFCPDGVVTRADMAGYLWRAVMGANTPPPVYQNIFTDVTFNQYNSAYIQGIYDLGLTAGCEDGTKYCPNAINTRAQMSVFIWKGQFGSEAPPACTPGLFADVPCPSLFADYIEGLYNEGVTAGCGTNPLIFCPNANITNGQMAVFLVKGFNIPVLLP